MKLRNKKKGEIVDKDRMSVKEKLYVIDRISEATVELANSSPERKREFQKSIVERMKNTEKYHHCCFGLVDCYKRDGYYYYIYEKLNFGDEE